VRENVFRISRRTDACEVHEYELSFKVRDIKEFKNKVIDRLLEKCKKIDSEAGSAFIGDQEEIEKEIFRLRLGFEKIDNRAPIIRFLEERIVKDPGSSGIGATELFVNYVKWCSDRGIKQETQTFFGTQLRCMGYEKIKKYTHLVYKGIKFRDMF